MMGLALLLIVLQTAAAPKPQADNATAARQAFEEGNALFEKMENDKALAAYDRAIALDAKQADFHLGRCRTLARLQRHDEAITSCSEAITLKPDFAAAFLDRGHFLINARKVDRALPDPARARTLNADPYGVAYHVALANYLIGAYVKSAAEYDACSATATIADYV